MKKKEKLDIDGEMSQKEVFYIYVDWTQEEVPRAFYVGKGVITRVNDQKKRNVYWGRVKEKYGINREVIFATIDEKYAFEIEKLKIKEYKTHKKYFVKNSNSIPCNLTLGGEGPIGAVRSKTTRKKLSRMQRGENSSNAKRNWKIVRAIRRDYLTGNFTQRELKIKYNIATVNSILNNRSWRSNQYQKKLDALPANWQLLQKGKFLSQNRPFAKLNKEKVKIIREKYLTELIGINQLAKEFNVSKLIIDLIIKNKRWKDENYILPDLTLSKKATYVFLDRITDIDHPYAQQVFFIGIGSITSLRNKGKGNWRWKEIINSSNNWNREVILGTTERKYAEEIQKQLIEQYKTFEIVRGVSRENKGYWGANLKEYFNDYRELKPIPENKIKRLEYLKTSQFTVNSKISKENADQIRKKYQTGKFLKKELAQEYKVSRDDIKKIIYNQAFTDLEYIPPSIIKKTPAIKLTLEIVNQVRNDF